MSELRQKLEASVALEEAKQATVVRPTAPNDGTVILSMIDRLAARPDIDVVKIREMIDLHRSMQVDAARRAYDEAFPAMTAELPEIDKRGKIIIKKKDSEQVIQSTPYALWDDTNRMIKPILAKHGFGLSFRISQTPDKITTTAVLSHCCGHREETSFAASIDSTGSKNNVQGWGSSFSYGKRYTGTAILNITTRGEDDDGKAAGDSTQGPTAADIEKLITDTKSNRQWFLQEFSVETLEDLTASQRKRCHDLLTAKASKAGKPNG